MNMCTSKITPKKILLSLLLVFSAIVSAEENNPCLHNNTGFCGVPLKPENLQSLTLSYPVPTAKSPADVRSLIRSAVNSKLDSKTLLCKICGEEIKCDIDITQVTIITGNNTYTGKGTATGNVYLRCSSHVENGTFSTRIVPFTIKFEDTDDDDNDCSSGHSHDWSDWSYHCELESPSQESYSIYNTDTDLGSFIKAKANELVKDKSYKSKICSVCQKERKENYSHSADWLCGYYSPYYHIHNTETEMTPPVTNGKRLYCVRMDSGNCTGEFAVIPVWIQQAEITIDFPDNKDQTLICQPCNPSSKTFIISVNSTITDVNQKLKIEIKQPDDEELYEAYLAVKLADGTIKSVPFPIKGSEGANLLNVNGSWRGELVVTPLVQAEEGESVETYTVTAKLTDDSLNAPQVSKNCKVIWDKCADGSCQTGTGGAGIRKGGRGKRSVGTSITARPSSVYGNFTLGKNSSGKVSGSFGFSSENLSLTSLSDSFKVQTVNGTVSGKDAN
ncbi:MAG: hypothetical protein IJW17_14460, partial [Lentisphaeria bacterium]|nr:hypothetical protein [Lentisphaeria bacterium]